MRASLRVDRTGFVPGDQILVDAEILNSTGSAINKSYIHLLRVNIERLAFNIGQC